MHALDHLHTCMQPKQCCSSCQDERLTLNLRKPFCNKNHQQHYTLSQKTQKCFINTEPLSNCITQSRIFLAFHAVCQMQNDMILPSVMLDSKLLYLHNLHLTCTVVPSTIQHFTLSTTYSVYIATVMIKRHAAEIII